MSLSHMWCKQPYSDGITQPMLRVQMAFIRCPAFVQLPKMYTQATGSNTQLRWLITLFKMGHCPASGVDNPCRTTSLLHYAQLAGTVSRKCEPLQCWYSSNKLLPACNIWCHLLPIKKTSPDDTDNAIHKAASHCHERATGFKRNLTPM